MNPAYSVILFTTASGAGYGLLIWLAAATIMNRAPGSLHGLIGLGLGLALISLGLLSSMLHLGHPERAWRAMSQWRSSWLSREGVVALITYPPAVLWGLAWWFKADPVTIQALAAVTAALALLTVFCTAMIYASLKPIPRWRHPMVPPVYLGFALATGGLLFHALMAIAGFSGYPLAQWTALVIALAWACKIIYWQGIDTAPTKASAAAAIGLPEYSMVKLLEAPHTQDNYLMREMGYRIARKHVSKLRRIALFGAMACISLVLATPGFTGHAASGWAVLAALIGGLSVVLERWLFFAEARHLVTLYYGQEQI